MTHTEQPDSFQTIPEFLQQAANRWPDRHAVRAGKVELSFQTLNDRVTAVARGLAALGVGQGDRVAVFLTKRTDTAVVIFAILRAQAVLVPINPALKPKQIAHILQDCAPRVFVVQRDRADRLVGVLSALPPDARTVYVDPGKEAAGEALSEITAAADYDVTLSPGLPDIDGRSLAALLYTSGSTGKPKGVMVSHKNLACGVDSVVSYLSLTEDDRILCSLPFSFDYGLNQLLASAAVGACAVLIDYFHPQQVLRLIESERITGLAGVPTMWVQLASQQWADGALGSLRYITNSGDRMPAKTLKTLRTRLPQVRIFLMYGFTEAFRGTYLDPDLLDDRADSIGKPVPNVEIEVRDEDGRVVPPGSVGELVQGGSLVTCGYWRDPDGTAEKYAQTRSDFVHPDWVRSGDLVWRDEAGFLYFSGRKDHLIKTAGYRVSRSEVEEVLEGGEQLLNAAVIAPSHEVWGQQIVAFVSSQNGSAVDTVALIQHCRRQLPRYMVPAKIEVLPELPQSANGKIDYKALIGQLEVGLNVGQAVDASGVE